MPVEPSRRSVHAVLRSRLRTAVLLLVVGTLSIAATAASGSQPSEPTPIPDSAFRPVTVPPAAGAVADGVAEGGVVHAAPRSASGPTATALPELRDIVFPPDPPERAQPSVAPAKPVVVNVPPPAPKTTHVLRGYASYYCRAGSSPCTYGYPDRGGFQAYAAAGPDLRAALGSGWRGSIVYVDGIRVKLIDWCQCYKGQSNEKLLDLYYDVFSRTGSPVTIRW